MSFQIDNYSLFNIHYSIFIIHYSWFNIHCYFLSLSLLIHSSHQLFTCTCFLYFTPSSILRHFLSHLQWIPRLNLHHPNHIHSCLFHLSANLHEAGWFPPTDDWITWVSWGWGRIAWLGIDGLIGVRVSIKWRRHTIALRIEERWWWWWWIVAIQRGVLMMMTKEVVTGICINAIVLVDGEVGIG